MARALFGDRLRKQVTVVLPAVEWRALRDEAARQRLPMTELCRQWLRPGLDRLRTAPPLDASSEPRRPHVESIERQWPG